ncbi:hypothetical protein DF161_19885 [Burkholderia stagnalis]|nr:hypothetical protein WJ02_11335 [Burkholderia vietnamiensis]RQQ13180.1 hypothetical protein DF161_19885 [Burkholderia stagnalis]RQX93884.1 hypothetical protein DF120_10860 [Burkholderia stagnalis]RQX99556.1 hypothetical protein DF119_13735 [Burkholderia stagnalis]RQY41842.1 hypothetical protein DF116_08940 [Burkholderia stagnalis]
MLETLFPGLLLIPVVKAGECLSLAEQTTRNKLHCGTFPVKTVMLGGKRLVKKTDLADYITELGAEKRPRGRPTKAAILARERGGE